MVHTLRCRFIKYMPENTSIRKKLKTEHRQSTTSTMYKNKETLKNLKIWSRGIRIQNSRRMSWLDHFTRLRYVGFIYYTKTPKVYTEFDNLFSQTLNFGPKMEEELIIIDDWILRIIKLPFVSSSSVSFTFLFLNHVQH